MSALQRRQLLALAAANLAAGGCGPVPSHRGPGRPAVGRGRPAAGTDRLHAAALVVAAEADRDVMRPRIPPIAKP